MEADPVDCTRLLEELREHAAATRLRVDVTSAGLVLTKTLRLDVRRRVLLAMSRFGPEVHSVSVHLLEARNPLGGVDQRCRVRARLRSGPNVRAEAINGEAEAAVGRCAARLARLVAEALDGDAGHEGWAHSRRPPGSDR